MEIFKILLDVLPCYNTQLKFILRKFFSPKVRKQFVYANYFSPNYSLANVPKLALANSLANVPQVCRGLFFSPSGTLANVIGPFILSVRICKLDTSHVIAAIWPNQIRPINLTEKNPANG